MQPILRVLCCGFLLAACVTTSTAQAPAIVGPRTYSDSLALAISIYSVALTNGTQTAHAADHAQLVCVKGTQPNADPPAAVLAALQSNRTLLIRPMSACRQEPLGGPAPRGASLVVDTLTGKRGIWVSAGVPVFNADGTFGVETRYYQHGLSGAGWQCRGKRRSDGGWEITTCTMLWIS